VFARHNVYTEDDPFAAQRERVRELMRRLFGVCGRRHWRSLAMGQIGGLFARLFEILAPLVLGVTVDAVFLRSRPYELPFRPASLALSAPDAQFAFSIVGE
jgi:ATP-binding cassette subfamily B protein